MNTLVHLAALVAVGWLTHWVFTEMNEPILGAGCVLMWAWLVPMTWVAVLEDREILSQG